MATNSFDLNLKKGVIDKLKSLAPKLEKKYLNGALRAGALIVQHAAQERARAFDDPKTPKAVWKEIVIRTNASLGRQNQGKALQVGVLGGAAKYSNTAVNRRKRRVGRTYITPGNVYYWRFLEFGTSKMAAKPFMRPALEGNINTASDAITTKLNTAIDQLAKG
jgi:HK97 gp10 family phage protein